MKILSCSMIAMLYLLQGAIAQPQNSSHQTAEADLNIPNSFTQSATTTDDLNALSAENTPHLIGDSLGLPIMRDQLTITESTQGGSLSAEDIESTYGKMMQDFAATLEDGDTEANTDKQAHQKNRLFDILIGFVIEVVITLIVLKIAFLIGEFRYRFAQIVPISLAIAFVGALLNLTLGIGLLNPIQIGLSFVIMLMMLRMMTEAHEWAAALQITLVARLVSIGMAWLACAGTMVLFGL